MKYNINKKVYILPIFTIIIILSIFILYNLIHKENSIEKATNFLIDKINNEEKHYMKSVVYGNIEQCGNCKDGSRGAPVYSFFISKAVGDKLNKNEISKIFKKIETKGESLWGYDGKPEVKEWSDADDTAFAMRSLQYFNKEYNLENLNYFYIQETKTFKSFNENSVMQDSRENFESHPEVNANIYNLFLETNQKNNFTINYNYIEQSQNEDGSFKSFYYPSKYYSTYMFLDFLCSYKNDNKQLLSIKQKAISFILKTQNKNGSWGKNDGNNYETALALASLKSCNIKNISLYRGQKALLKSQNKDGSWDSNEIFWTFKLDKNTHWNTYINQILTTAIAIIALN